MKAAHPEVAAATRENPGETLRQARESRGWDQGEVARKLNLTVSSLKNLEDGAFDKLPGHTFARGYIRAYAKLLDMDQAALVQSFDGYTGTHAQGSDVHALGRIEEPVRLSHNILRIVSLLLLVVVVGGGFIWWKDQSGNAGKELFSLAPEHIEVESADGTTQIHPLDEPEDQAVAAGEQPEAVAPTSEPLPLAEVAPQTPVAPVTSTPATPAATAAPATPGAAAAPAAQPAPAAPVAPVAPVTAPVVAAATPAPAAPAEVPAGSGQVSLKFTGACWFSVTDGNGKLLTQATKKNGDVVEVVGKLPLSLHLGAARAVQVSYNGQPVDLAPSTRGEIARLKLGQ
ncbi:RodZ domain-containing protein [Pseudomonas wadenswilerensis]